MIAQTSPQDRHRECQGAAFARLARLLTLLHHQSALYNWKLPMAGLEPARAFYGPTDFKSVASAISPHRRHVPRSLTISARVENEFSSGGLWRLNFDSQRSDCLWSGCWILRRSQRRFRTKRYHEAGCHHVYIKARRGKTFTVARQKETIASEFVKHAGANSPLTCEPVSLYGSNC